MIEATLSDLRNSQRFIGGTEVVHIVDGRKNKPIGYFIPQAMIKDFEPYLTEYEATRKLMLLKRIAQAQKIDAVGDGAVADGMG